MAGDDVCAAKPQNTVAPKITPEMMKSYNGEGDFVAWLAKAKLIARLAKITDLACFVPLYLEGDALAVYLEMSDAEQANFVRIDSGNPLTNASLTSFAYATNGPSVKTSFSFG